MARNQATIQKEINSQLENLEFLKQELKDAKKRSYLKCYHCNKKSLIKNIVAIRVYWYEEPYGCTGGDTWHPEDLEFNCPKCKCRNRLLDQSTMSDNMDAFKKILDEYSEQITES